jgi:hypothetical protein
MSWEQPLEVLGGEVWFEQSGEGQTYKAQGTLHCTKEFLVWFQVDDYPDDRLPFPGLAGMGMLTVLDDAPRQNRRVSLRPRAPAQPDTPAPDSFLNLCFRLLAPLNEEERYGYIFSTDLQVKGGQLFRFGLNEQMHNNHEASFVEFAHAKRPYVLIQAGKRRPLEVKSPEEFRKALSALFHWPPHLAKAQG